MIQNAEKEKKDQVVEIQFPSDYPQIGDHQIVKSDSVKSLDYNCSFIQELTDEPNSIPQMFVKASVFDKRKGKAFPQIIKDIQNDSRK